MTHNYMLHEDVVLVGEHGCNHQASHGHSQILSRLGLTINYLFRGKRFNQCFHFHVEKAKGTFRMKVKLFVTYWHVREVPRGVMAELKIHEQPWSSYTVCSAVLWVYWIEVFFPPFFYRNVWCIVFCNENQWSQWIISDQVLASVSESPK